MAFMMPRSADDEDNLKTAIIDNYDNNQTQSTTKELSDLYGCSVPLSIKIVNGTQKSKKVDFASLEHAWCVRRMIRSPLVGSSTQIVTVKNMQQMFTTTTQDAICFLEQFEMGGVFGSWQRFNEYFAIGQITGGPKGEHNIGLIARFVCSNAGRADQIRAKIRGVAADRWKRSGDAAAKSIACCLWRGAKNYGSYKMGLAVLTHIKYVNNPVIGNVLHHTTQNMLLHTTFQQCRMVTTTRKRVAKAYMDQMHQLGQSLQWKLAQDMFISLHMAMHRRLGSGSVLSCINMDTFMAILLLVVDTKQAHKIKKYWERPANAIPRALAHSHASRQHP
jgi:hypothetical protein